MAEELQKLTELTERLYKLYPTHENIQMRLRELYNKNKSLGEELMEVIKKHIDSPDTTPETYKSDIDNLKEKYPFEEQNIENLAAELLTAEMLQSAEQVEQNKETLWNDVYIEFAHIMDEYQISTADPLRTKYQTMFIQIVKQEGLPAAISQLKTKLKESKMVDITCKGPGCVISGGKKRTYKRRKTKKSKKSKSKRQ